MNRALEYLFFRGIAIGFIGLLLSCVCSAQEVFVSEVMPENGGALLDEDGEASDWIELYNASGDPVNLGGWYLTDDDGDRVKWIFPDTTLASGGFLVVFASDKNRAVSGQELHTNFKLKASGEYIALVRPDGIMVEDGYSFPEVSEGVSYGREFTGVTQSVLIDEGAPCSVHVPVSAEDQVGWQSVSFDDSGWEHGISAVGYDASSGFESLIQLNLLRMRYLNLSAYARFPFVVNNPEAATGLTLDLKYDDGFVLYLNGSLLFSENTDGSTDWNSGAGGAGSDEQSMTFETFELSEFLANLVPGTNILAFQLMNDAADRQDLLMLPILAGGFSVGINTVSHGILETPTPGRPNASSLYEGVVEEPVAVPGHGFYDAPVDVVLSCVTTGSVIRFTTDGSVPTTNSALYTGPLSISSTTVLKARAFRDGWKSSFPHAETYLFPDDVVQQPSEEYSVNSQALVFGMDAEVVGQSYLDASNQVFTVIDALKAIPSISISTADENLFDPDMGIYVNAYERWERPASVELIDSAGQDGFHINAGLRIRGGYSRHPMNPKHSFRLFFREEYGAGKLKFPLFGDEGVDEFDKIDLRTAQNYSWAWSRDLRNTLLRDVFCRDAALDMGDPATRSRYYHVYLNGLYWGLFMTEERPEARHAAAYLGGDKDDYDTIKRKNSREGVEATDGNLDAFTRLYDAAMDGFEDNADYFAVQGLDVNGNPDELNERLADLANMIDYLLLIYYSGATDNCVTWFSRNSTINNMYAVYNREAPDGFKWVQHDCEHAFDTSTDPDRTGPFDHANFRLMPHFNAQTLHEKLCVNAEYRLLFADRVYKHFKHGGALVQENSEARLDARKAQIDRAIVAHAARWGSVQLNRDCWLDAVQTLREVFAGRCDEVIGYLREDGLIPSIPPPETGVPAGFVASGTAVSLMSSEGVIYYTTDGSDPRAIGGSPVGQLYSNPVVITQPTVLRARARKSDGEWSAERQLVYQTPDVPLAITEVMYHADSNQLDFIEIQNVSSEPVSLSGYWLGNAVEFEFGVATLDPGEFAVIADDTAALLSASVIPADTFIGEYSGNLDNSGEKVSLRFFDSSLVSFSYSDARNWPQAADGGGHSLVPLTPAMAMQSAGSLDYGGNWRASALFNGSPGAVDPDPAVSIVINEVIAHTDLTEGPFDSNDKMELYNASDSLVDVSGWALSDELNELDKWTIPGGTTLPAGGYLIFDEDDFHPGRTNGFGLNKAGEMVVLSASDRIVDTVRFKGQANGDSYGRVSSVPKGASDWMLLSPTPGAANSDPSLALRITQVMYHPTNDNAKIEYIQLSCLQPDLSMETDVGSWRIDGGVSYDFPAGTTLSTGTLWVVSFDPENDPTALGLFCEAYGLTAAEETFFGPYEGQLSNGGERVAVEYPQASDDPLDPFDTSWVVVDEVFYFDQAPWPEEADGAGSALIRTGWSTWGAGTP